MKLLQDKLALITGGGGGLGSAMARGFVEHGARVLIADVRKEAAEAVANALRETGAQAWALGVDLSSRERVRAFADDVRARFGAIDVLVNNAGISPGRVAVDDPAADDIWDRVLDVNLHSLFDVTRAFIPALKESKGCVINLSSVSAFVTGISSAGYVSSKGAVRSLTQVLARDLAPYGIRVNAVAPGVMRTPMVAPLLQQEGGVDWYLQRVPMKRCGEPEEVVGPVVFLASALATYVTGTVLPVDGGFLSA